MRTRGETTNRRLGERAHCSRKVEHRDTKEIRRRMPPNTYFKEAATRGREEPEEMKKIL